MCGNVDYEACLILKKVKNSVGLKSGIGPEFSRFAHLKIELFVERCVMVENHTES